MPSEPKFRSFIFSHVEGWADRQFSQWPHEEYESTTWSPGPTVFTFAPARSTMPAPSCPRTIG